MDYIKRTFNDEWRQGNARCSHYKVLSSCPVWNIKRMKSLAHRDVERKVKYVMIWYIKHVDQVQTCTVKDYEASASSAG